MEALGLKAGSSTEDRDVALAARGDVAAFERLYRKHAARVHTLARRLVGAAEADDATQEIFLRTWRRLDTFRGDAAFATWLVRLAKNVLFDRGRQLKVAGRREAVLDDDVPAVERPAIPSLDCEAALERLPDRARAVLVLHDIEGHTHLEIAEQLGITAGTSKSQLHRARALLRQWLGSKPDGVER